MSSRGNDTVLLLEEDEDRIRSSPADRRESSGSDGAFLKIAGRLFLEILKGSWPLGAGVFVVTFFFYWFFNGVTAFFLTLMAVGGLVLCLLYHAGDRLLYHPDQPPTSRFSIPSPATFGLSFEDIYIKSGDATKLHAFFIKQPPEYAGAAPTLLYLHGNAGNIGHRLRNVKGIVSSLKCNVLLLEYRGYGQSDGVPSEEGLYRDAQAALDYLKRRSDIHSSKIIVFGRSLGGAVAIDLSSRAENRDKVACVLIENTFTSVPDIARDIFNFKIVRWVPRWFYKNQFPSRWKVREMTTPVLFLSGGSDALIPSTMMKELYDSCGSSIKLLAKFPGGTHNETWTCPKYYQTIIYFFEEEVHINGTVDGRERVRAPTPIVNGNTHISVIY